METEMEEDFLFILEKAYPVKSWNLIALRKALKVFLLKLTWENVNGSYLQKNHPPWTCDKYYFDYYTRGLAIYSTLYDKFVLVGDFNVKESEETLEYFLNYQIASNIVKNKISFKSLSNPS